MVQKKLDPITEIIGTGFYSGYSDFAPGTMGTLVAIPFAIFFNYIFNPIIYFIFILGLIIYGSFISWELENYFEERDSQKIVIDEIIGYLIATFNIKFTFFKYIIAFLIFRFFDITKPFFIKNLEKKYNPGFSVIIDDVIAGIFTLIIMIFVQILT